MFPKLSGVLILITQNYIWMTERAGIVSRVNVETGEKHVILNLSSIVTTESESLNVRMYLIPIFQKII